MKLIDVKGKIENKDTVMKVTRYEKFGKKWVLANANIFDCIYYVKVNKESFKDAIKQEKVFQKLNPTTKKKIRKINENCFTISYTNTQWVYELEELTIDWNLIIDAKKELVKVKLLGELAEENFQEYYKIKNKKKVKSQLYWFLNS